MILVIDNFDSFTYNLVQYVGQIRPDIVVRRNDAISLDEIAALAPDGIMMSPGPCSPGQSGICLDIIGAALRPDTPLSKQGKRIPVFGVCLGHQAIAEVAGGTVRQAHRIMHGKTSMVDHDGSGLLKGIPSPFRVNRYHSLVLARDTVPNGFVVTARSLDDDEIMGLRHETYPIEGVQFHPESILTDHGFQIIQNYADQVAATFARP